MKHALVQHNSRDSKTNMTKKTYQPWDNCNKTLFVSYLCVFNQTLLIKTSVVLSKQGEFRGMKSETKLLQEVPVSTVGKSREVVQLHQTDAEDALG